MLRHLVGACLLASILAHPIRAQDGPESTAQAYGDAIKANDWAGAARLMHPRALGQLRELFEPLLSSPSGDGLRAQLFGAASAEELASTPDTVLFANFLRLVSTRDPTVAEALRTATFSPLGHVRGGGDTAFVVSRNTVTIEEMTVAEFEVMPFVREDGRWWGLLKAEFTNMAMMFRRALGGNPS